jgi:hypothetical protein
MTAHDFVDPFDIRWATAGENGTESAPSWIGSAAVLGMNDFYSTPFKNASTRSPSSAAASSS